MDFGKYFFSSNIYNIYFHLILKNIMGHHFRQARLMWSLESTRHRNRIPSQQLKAEDCHLGLTYVFSHRAFSIDLVFFSLIITCWFAIQRNFIHLVKAKRGLTSNVQLPLPSVVDKAKLLLLDGFKRRGAFEECFLRRC